jgi:transcriptional regulator with XRE-family HTH domain
MTSAQLPGSPAVLPGTHAVRRQAFEQLRERAITLRRAGRSRREIKEFLGIASNATLDRALRGEPPPEWTRRPRAKDDLHARARELREQGLDYEEIAGALGVSKSSVSLWVRDMPRPARLSYEETRKRCAEGARRYWAVERPVREANREAVRAAAAAQIGDLSRARSSSLVPSPTGVRARRASRPGGKSGSSSSTATLG